MNMPGKDGLWALTEKEKQTLRLIVRGHDAKSTARSLGLSVHTINERLRDARRKMAVSSSREAARLLLAAEGGAEPAAPDLLGDRGLGEDAGGPETDQGSAPASGVGRALRRPRIIIGVLLMTLLLGLLALAASPHAASAPPAAEAAANAEAVAFARQWLTLLDQGRWDESYQATGAAFQKQNTVEVWASVSEKVRRPLGAAISRSFLSQENLPAPPAGYEVIKFRTRFASKGETVETVTLERENGDWRVVGVTID
ncbi:MAG: LuxR family transcriptional regulator [Sphingomonas sanxanigenens]|uniref:LuxR family transcriptional regulator n=1 Tax=Sphingomonas sanxanigenens TaxID=397260 RepID=A0A2W5C2A8_9SPHN|nr:MAG: LuxR family transcriptional regulator [Sphingomonas sanxanigenens]